MYSRIWWVLLEKHCGSFWRHWDPQLFPTSLPCMQKKKALPLKPHMPLSPGNWRDNLGIWGTFAHDILSAPKCVCMRRRTAWFRKRKREGIPLLLLVGGSVFLLTPQRPLPGWIRDHHKYLPEETWAPLLFKSIWQGRLAGLLEITLHTHGESFGTGNLNPDETFPIWDPCLLTGMTLCTHTSHSHATFFFKCLAPPSRCVYLFDF